MKNLHILIIAIVFLGIMGAIGFFNPTNCSQIGPCSNCWSDTEIQVTSDLCPNPNEPCLAEPALQQHNAVVDTLLCACEASETSGDVNLFVEIEEAHFAMQGGCTDEVLTIPVATREANGVFCILDAQRIDAVTLCNAPDQYLTKRPY